MIVTTTDQTSDLNVAQRIGFSNGCRCWPSRVELRSNLPIQFNAASVGDATFRVANAYYFDMATSDAGIPFNWHPF